jgi:putative methionine-R-sulfoxide reductase with GAF domain
LFLVDDARAYAVLRAGTGEAGAAMMAAGHKLKVGGASMIGQCIATGEPRIALDVGEEAVRFENPHLPDTHSEMALPLRSRDWVMGALTVQSVKVAAFDERVSPSRRCWRQPGDGH